MLCMIEHRCTALLSYALCSGIPSVVVPVTRPHDSLSAMCVILCAPSV